MKEHLPGKHSVPLEPGLLPIFRLYIAVRLSFVLIAGGAYVVWYRPAFGPGLVLNALPFLIDIFLLFIFLSWSWPRRWLGQLYLPVSLLVSVLGPVIQVGYVLPAYDTDATFAFLLGFSLLLVPLILTAWQYSFGWVLLFGLSTSLFEFLLLSSAAELDVTALRWSTVALVGRSLLAIFIGYIVSHLIDQQRRQRRELGDANVKLIRYATTLELLAVSRERNRLARELHDTLAHALSGLAVQLDAISAIWNPMPAKARAMLDRALSITRIGLDETRNALLALRATPLEDMGLVLSIRDLAENAAARGGFRVDLDLPGRISDLAPEVELCYYRVAQEALENVIKHASATKVTILLRQDNTQLSLQVSDDGLGFEDEPRTQEDRFGIKGMRERADLIGGTLEVESHAGQGASIHLCYERRE